MNEPQPLRCPVAAAEHAARWWAVAVSAQRAKPRAAVDHGDLYGLACELVATLRTLQDLAGLLARQAAGYGDGRVLREDAGADPYARLDEAAANADALHAEIGPLLDRADAYWSAIGHIGLEVGPDDVPGDDLDGNRRGRP